MNERLTIVDVIRDQVSQHPQKRLYTFLKDGEVEQDSLTYAQVDERARAIAARLQRIARPGERAILLYPSGLDYISAFLACLYAGVVPVPSAPVPSNRRPDTLLTMMADAQAALILTTVDLHGTLQSILTNWPISPTPQLIATDKPLQESDATDWHPPLLTDESLAVLIYTSGSTKVPRGIMMTHGNLMNIVQASRRSGGRLDGQVGVSWMPPHHGSGLGNVTLQPLVLGTHIVLMSPTAFLERPARWLEAITHYQAANSGGPNFAYQLCVDKVSPAEREGLDLSSWQRAALRNEPIQPQTLAQFAEAFGPVGFRKEAFYSNYGLTEATFAIAGRVNPGTFSVQRTALEQNRVVPAQPGNADSVTLVSCGKPNSAAQVQIVDPNSLVVCQPDQVGEIWVSGRYAAHGYWNKPAETKETFQAYLVNTGDGPFLRSGDMGFIHEGELYIAGRLKDMIIIRGRNVYSMDIEQAAGQAHPSLLPGATAAFSVPVNTEEQLAIIHEVKPGVDVDVDEVARAVRQAIAVEMELPVYAVMLVEAGSLPRTPNGKIQRYQARAQFIEMNGLTHD